MNWLRTRQRAAWICGATLLVPLLIYFNALFGLVSLGQDYRSDIERLNLRTARLQGLYEQEAVLRESSEKAGSLIAQMVYPATDDSATISASLQTGVREILADAGLSVTNSQVLPVRAQENFQFVGLRLTVTGDIGALDRALSELAQFQPMLLVESLAVKPASINRALKSSTQRITVTLQVLSLRSL